MKVCQRMRRSISLFFTILFCIIGQHHALFCAYAAEEMPILSTAYVLMEAETGTILSESESQQMISCGVMAKLMTAYLVAQQLECDAWSLDTILTAGNEVDDVSGAVI